MSETAEMRRAAPPSAERGAAGPPFASQEAGRGHQPRFMLVPSSACPAKCSYCFGPHEGPAMTPGFLGDRLGFCGQPAVPPAGWGRLDSRNRPGAARPTAARDGRLLHPPDSSRHIVPELIEGAGYASEIVAVVALHALQGWRW